MRGDVVSVALQCAVVAGCAGCQSAPRPGRAVGRLDPPARAGCHGTHGEGGGNGPSLIKGARTDLPSIVSFVKSPKPPMPDLHPSPLNDEAVDAVSKYVRTLQGAKQR